MRPAEHPALSIEAGGGPSNVKVRVLSVVGSMMLGGAETYVAGIARAIGKYGVHMEICALERTGPLLEVLEKDGVRVHDTPYPGPEDRFTSGILRTIDTIRRIVKSGRFDIVHTYMYWSDIVGVAGARLAGCRRIIVSRQSMHGWIHEPSVFRHSLEQLTNVFANEVVACSQAALRDAQARERLLPARRTVIYNAIDVDNYEANVPNIDGPLRLVTVGALAHRKGQEYAIDAMSQVAKAGVEATLELVGAGPDEAMLRGRVADAGLGGVITFVGQHADPRPFLHRADVFLLPSRQEGFSLALLEAMASSMPVIATDVGGNAEAVLDGKGGRIVPPLQPAALAAAIVEMSRRRQELAEMGRFNRLRVRELFSVEASARSLAEWYIDGPRY